MQRFLFIIFALLCSSCALANSACNNTISDAQLVNLKANQFQPAKGQVIDQVALSLLPCVGHTNPAIRDGVVYEAYQHWLRSNLLSTNTVQQLLQALLLNLQNSANDAEQFRTAFSALILAEVVRVDRMQPYLNANERQQVVDKIAQFMTAIADYRGFSEQEGWRHNVAHTADAILQLSLNKALSAAQGQTLLTALLSQVAPQQHFYHFGEPKRIALPVLYLLLQEKIDQPALLKQLQDLASPAPFASWQAVYQSEQGLAKLHNTRSFFQTLYLLTSSSQNTRLQALAPAVLELIQSMG
ncbi:DUF2785 domain-containing protein [Rheinheimera maricola]|uniref:DUF2785 domain-containing protein n=1 Tax=Rheinheimera maricola TaxID=2793282 RepID=A0ABS7XCC6_9GAMM|nr:DUF2785 domain-containing protein [Rheinheimera maricola]MBZ9613218.1 DUF2785 domain-containing protein [Rheinheimera maricola]